MLPYDLLYLYDEWYQHQYLLISSKLRFYGPEMSGNRSGAAKHLEPALCSHCNSAQGFTLLTMVSPRASSTSRL